LSLKLRRRGRGGGGGREGGGGRPGRDLSADAPDEVRDKDVELLGGEELREGGRAGGRE